MASKYKGKSYALTIEQSTEARRLYSTGDYTLKEIAARYDVHWMTIRRAIAAAGEPVAPPFGERTDKLTDDQVAAIRAQYAAGGVSQTELAKAYHVTPGMIGHIVAGRRRKSGE